MAQAKKPKLTVKQAKFVKGVAEGKPKYKAAMDAYNTTSMDVAANIANENLKKTTIQEALHIALEKAGITVDLAVAPISQALKDDDLDMRLKGSDRALRLMLPKTDNPTVNINFNQAAQRDSDEFGL
jgi:hypothetical protein